MMNELNELEMNLVTGGTQNNGEILSDAVTNTIEENMPIIDAIADGAGKIWDLLMYIYNK